MLIASLPVLEARASSEIENVVTTADALFRSLPRSSVPDPAAREGLRYREAPLDCHRSIETRPLGTRTAEAIATRIEGVETQVRRHPGTVLRNEGTGETIYTPPAGHDRLRSGSPILYLSRHIIAHEETYYDRLRAVTAEGAWTRWITFMLEAVESTAT